MAEDVIISARGLGKRYVIGHQAAERVPTLRDAIVRNTKGLLRTGKDMLRGKPLVAGDTREEFWALKDVNFDIRRGDVVGIIGRNGAGKSTLLKVLSRITEPSKGRVEIKGRIASLLEVGTGFHPELTGRENIYLNGAILGMGRQEIRRKFDEIVAFAEIEKFLDTPVKRYSSGMYVRLAFAVAAHLEPEILIVDEVLAVGDVEFQKKCLGKMQDVASGGRTVLFVSHNLSTIASLCPRSILMGQGTPLFDGPSSETIREYSRRQSRIADQNVAITQAGCELTVVSVTSTQSHQDGSIEIVLQLLLALRHPQKGAVNFLIKDEMGRPVGACSCGGMGSSAPLPIGHSEKPLRFHLVVPRLAQGSYSVDLEVATRDRTRIGFFPDLIGFSSMPTPERNCSEVLMQSWGFGALWAGVTEA